MMTQKIALLLALSLSVSVFAQDESLLENPTTHHVVSTPEEMISPGPYIAGGVVGTLLGFGAGHIIQGRWQKIGWVFTLGDAVSMVSFFTTALMAMDSALKGSTSFKSYQALTIVSSVLLVAFRIWEVADVWATPGSNVQWPQPIEEKPTNKIALLDPIPNQEIAIPVINMAF